jgi:soluble lytic murein transglycosylase-like protein
MSRIASRVLSCIFLAACEMYAQGGTTQDEQINRLLEGVHSRVNEAALAATSLLSVDRYLREAERLGAAGRRAEARTELEAAIQVIADADRSVSQDDFLLQDYRWKVRYALNTLDGTREEASTKDVTSHGVSTPDFLPVIQRALIANALPPQLSAVAIVESGGNLNALSPKGARGLWQLMPDTARRYGLRVDAKVDDRLDPLKSTHAAVQYLRDLFDMFHDWSLALAAYNAGENRIQSVMERTGVRRFAEMADRRLLPSETIQYVPAVLKMMR